MDDPYAPIARFYDRAVTHDADLPLYEALAHRYGDPILEVGAGTGRIAVPLARAGHTVVALEPSSEMLVLGRARAEREGVTVRWVQQQIESCTITQDLDAIPLPTKPVVSFVQTPHDRIAIDGRPTAYVCHGFVCRLPVTVADALAAELREPR